MRNLLVFVPTEWALLLIVGAGLAMIVGSRTFASCLFGAALALVFLPVVLGPLFDLLPMWLLIMLLAGSAFGLVRALSGMVIGKRETEQVIAILVADVIRFIFLAPFRLLAWVIRSLVRR